MRTKSEVQEVLKKLDRDSREHKALVWAMQTCGLCEGRGAISGCESCGRVRMCNCDGSVHAYGLGCL